MLSLQLELYMRTNFNLHATSNIMDCDLVKLQKNYLELCLMYEGPAQHILLYKVQYWL